MRSRLGSLFSLNSGKVVDPNDLADGIQFLTRFISDPGTYRRLRLVPADAKPALVFSDATGHGGCVAVLISETLDTALFIDGAVPNGWRQLLTYRKTQVTSFELFAAVAAIYTWRDKLCQRPVGVFLDNDAALGMLRKGACPKKDLHRFVQMARKPLAELHIEVFFYRVPSDSNCAGPPSRKKPCPFGSYVGIFQRPAIDWQ